MKNLKQFNELTQNEKNNFLAELVQGFREAKSISRGPIIIKSTKIEAQVENKETKENA